MNLTTLAWDEMIAPVGLLKFLLHQVGDEDCPRFMLVAEPAPSDSRFIVKDYRIVRWQITVDSVEAEDSALESEDIFTDTIFWQHNDTAVVDNKGRYASPLFISRWRWRNR